MKNSVKLLALVALISSSYLSLSQDVSVIAFTNMTDGQIVYPQDTIDVELNVSNLGTTTVAQNDYDSLPISLYANGKLIAQHPFGGQDWLASQTYSVVLLTMNNFHTWGDHNIDSGVVSLCAKTFIWKNGVNIDTDQSNDELCLPTIILIGPPGTGPSGLDKKEYKTNKVYYNQGTLNIRFKDSYRGFVQYSVSDVNGRTVDENKLLISDQNSYQLSLPNLTTGIYIARLVFSSGDVENFKFSVE